MKKATYSIGLAFLLICCIFLIPACNGNNNEIIDEGIATSEYSNVEKDENVFVLTEEGTNADGSVNISLCLTGNVCICRFSLSVLYDNSVLELINYDDECGEFSPIVNPEKENGTIIGDNTGVINLSWANAQNITSNSRIINMTFKRNDFDALQTGFTVMVKGINRISNQEVTDAQYTVENLIVYFDEQ